MWLSFDLLSPLIWTKTIQEACTKSSSLQVSQSFRFKYKFSLFQHIFICMLMAPMVILCFTLHFILSGFSRHIPIDPSKLSLCSLNINCYFTDLTFFIFISSLSYLSLSTLIDKNSAKDTSPCWRQRKLTGIRSNFIWRHLMRPIWIW